MHKLRLNEWVLRFIIEPDGPLLIKSGLEAGADPTLPSMNFVRTCHPVSGERTIYIPGSSFKGVLRSHTERIIRTVYDGDSRICCDPLSRSDSCSKLIQRENRRRGKSNALTTAEEYQHLCLACRIFGHMVHASHLMTADAYPKDAIDTLPIRHNVAIDRLSGGVAVGPFDMEVALDGKFETRVTLLNFECWQVGLLALALRDIAEGRVQIGYAKSRGLGNVKLYFGQLEVAYPGRFDVAGVAEQLSGVGALAPKLADVYGFVVEDTVEWQTSGKVVPDSAAWGRPAVRFGFSKDDPLTDLSDEELEMADREVVSALASVVPAWAGYSPSSGECHG